MIEKDLGKEYQLDVEDVKAALNSAGTYVDPLESVLSYVNGIGCYMKTMLAFMCPLGVTLAFVYFVQMFVAATPERHWCSVPELQGLDMELRRNLSAPGAADGVEWDRCNTFKANWTEVLATLKPPPANTSLQGCQHGWEFEYSDIPYATVVSEREWVCERATNVPTAQSMFFVGTVLGGLFFGWMADKYGRVPALVVSNLFACAGGVATIFTVGLWDFAITRLVVGMGYDNCFMLVYIIVLEYLDSRYRSIAGNLTIAMYFGCGSMVLPWLAVWLADWRTLLLVTSLPMLGAIAAFWLVPESARWLVSQRKVHKAVEVLRQFEKRDGIKIPQDAIDDFILASNRKQETDESLTALFKSGPLRRMMMYMAMIVIASSVSIDGLIRMSGSLGLDFFVTFTLTSATELPALGAVILVIDRWGRKILVFGPSLVAGILIIIGAFAPKGPALVTLAILARFFLNISLGAIIQWSTELSPTGVRATFSALLHMAGLIGVIMSPFIVYSERFWSPLPLLIFGSLAVVASGVVLLLPETKGLPMTQTIAHGEKLMNGHTLCGKPSKEELQDMYKK